MLHQSEPDLFDLIVAFADVKDGQCRWPLTYEDADMIVCGKPINPGFSWCHAHCKMAFKDFGKPHK